MIWDLTRGSEKWVSPPACNRGFLKKSEAVLFVYDIHDEYSLKEVEEWIECYFAFIANKQMIYLVANKCDLSTQTDQKYAR